MFVANLDPRMQKKHVKKLFKATGKVQVVEMGPEKGSARVDFEETDAAAKAVAKFSGKMALGKKLKVSEKEIEQVILNLRPPRTTIRADHSTPQQCYLSCR